MGRHRDIYRVVLGIQLTALESGRQHLTTGQLQCELHDVNLPLSPSPDHAPQPHHFCLHEVLVCHRNEPGSGSVETTHRKSQSRFR